MQRIKLVISAAQYDIRYSKPAGGRHEAFVIHRVVRHSLIACYLLNGRAKFCCFALVHQRNYTCEWMLREQTNSRCNSRELIEVIDHPYYMNLLRIDQYNRMKKRETAYLA